MESNKKDTKLYFPYQWASCLLKSRIALYITIQVDLMIKTQVWGYNITSVNFPSITKNNKKINNYMDR